MQLLANPMGRTEKPSTEKTHKHKFSLSAIPLSFYFSSYFIYAFRFPVLQCSYFSRMYNGFLLEGELIQHNFYCRNRIPFCPNLQIQVQMSTSPFCILLCYPCYVSHFCRLLSPLGSYGLCSSVMSDHISSLNETVY